MKPDIRELVREYGKPNIRFFITEDENQGYFRNPFGGKKEYFITDRYDIEKNYKIGLALVDKVRDDSGIAPAWFSAVLNERNYYLCDMQSILDRDGSHIEVYVLEDDPVTYRRIY